MLKVHGDCLKKLERKLPRSCVSVFNNQTTKNSPNKVLEKNFGTYSQGTNCYKRIFKDILLSVCGCECGQGFLVKGTIRSKKKKRRAKSESKAQPSSKMCSSRTFGKFKMKRKPRLKPIEKRFTTCLGNAKVNIFCF